MSGVNVDVQAYERDGFLVVRNLLTPDEVDRYKAAVEALEKVTSLTGHPYEAVLAQTHLVWRRDATLRDLTTSARAASIAAQLMGVEDPLVFLDQIVSKPPGGGSTVEHQDAPFLSFDGPSVNCWVALDDVGLANGALRYRQGSQRLGQFRLVHLDQADDLAREHVELEDLPLWDFIAAAGDAVFHDSHTVHGAYPNLSAAPRRAFSIQYMAADARFNGWMHDFLRPYRPEIGQLLDFPCFARVVVE